MDFMYAVFQARIPNSEEKRLVCTGQLFPAHVAATAEGSVSYINQYSMRAVQRLRFQVLFHKKKKSP